jgi:hypothetical protein
LAPQQVNEGRETVAIAQHPFHPFLICRHLQFDNQLATFR